MKNVLLPAIASLFLAATAHAATVTVTEGNGQNRALVAGSTDLEDAPPGGTGFDLDALLGGPFGEGDTIGIYGRIVSSVDRFTYSFTAGVNFDVLFDFDGYDLDNGDTVAAGLSGLIDQSVVTSGGDPVNDGGGKGVVISLFQGLTLIDSNPYTTNVTSATTSDNVIFGDVAAGSYTLVIDGSGGPNKGRPALYDIEISAVPLPLPGLLLVAGLGGLAALRRKTA